LDQCLRYHCHQNCLVPYTDSLSSSDHDTYGDDQKIDRGNVVQGGGHVHVHVLAGGHKSRPLRLRIHKKVSAPHLGNGKKWSTGVSTKDGGMDGGSEMERGIQACNMTEAIEHQKGENVRDPLRKLGPLLFQNSDTEAYHDFLTWNDPVDAFSPAHGSLLPLWTAQAPSQCQWSIMDIAISPRPSSGSSVKGKALHTIAVGYGTINTVEQFVGGRVSMYSLFDLQMPWHTVDVESGVTSLCFSPRGDHLAIGRQDGGVSVLNLDTMTISSSAYIDNHIFPVWSVMWHTAECLVSVSQDGLQGVWEYTNDDNDMDIKRKSSSAVGNEPLALSNDTDDDTAAGWSIGDGYRPDLAKMVCCAAATTIINNVADHLDTKTDHSAVNSNQSPTMYAYGTLEGEVIVVQPSSCCQTTEDGALVIHQKQHHKAPVYSVSFNPIDPQFMLSASLDWMLSLWNATTLTHALDIDVGEPITDAQWSPRSATTIGVVTEGGNAFVYDLAVSKELPLCSQRISGSAALTRIRFHDTHPIVIIGTSDGDIVILKLSPNLQCRKLEDESAEIAFQDDETEESTIHERAPLLLEDNINSLHQALKHPF